MKVLVNRGIFLFSFELTIDFVNCSDIFGFSVKLVKVCSLGTIVFQLQVINFTAISKFFNAFF